MDKRTKQGNKKLPLIISLISIGIVILILAIVFIIQHNTKTGLFRPGELIFDASTTEADQDFIKGILGDTELKKDLVVSHTSSPTKLGTSDNSVLYNILVPVTSFDDPTISIPADTLNTANLTSIWDLSSAQKLLAVSDQYYLNTFNSGALFEYLFFASDDKTELHEIVEKISGSIAAFPDENSVLTLAQTGVTALSRNMYTKLKQVGSANYFSENIAPFLSQFDYTHTSNESSFSNAASSQNICSAPEMIDVLTNSGIDIVELTGNHNQDCGDADAIATIDKYHELGMLTFGGGKTATEAAIPLEISAKNTNVTILGYNLSTGGYTHDDTPGANFYTEEKAIADITAAKERGDFIIVDIQYYECNSYVFASENTTCDYANSSAGDQINFFRHLIDLGANIVVGTAAHQPQTFEQYNGGEIYYGLGNLFFDQSWWPGTTRSLILVHYFYNGKLLQTRIVPTVYDQNYQTKLMDQTDAQTFTKRLLDARP